MNPTAEVWQPKGSTTEVWITINRPPYASFHVHDGRGGEINFKATPAQMRALVDQIVKGLAKLDETMVGIPHTPKGEG